MCTRSPRGVRGGSRAAALVALTCGCAGLQGDTGEATWDGGVYHVTVELDTADPLSDSDNGIESTVGTVADLLEDRLYLSVWQLNDTRRCDGNRHYPAELVESMQAWTGDWYVDLLLPEGDTCFAIAASISKDEVEIDGSFTSIYCSAGNDESVRSAPDVEESIQLSVTCELWYDGECEGDGC